MKKYAFITGENNEELAGAVAVELARVGFNESQCLDGQYSAPIYLLNHEGRGSVNSIENGERMWGLEDTVVISPSYVLAHAADLDGAKLPHEIPPEGYRLVTDEEREKYSPTDTPLDTMACCVQGSWVRARTGWFWDSRDSGNYAVPLDFTFKAKEVTMEELEAKYGCKVKVVRKG